MPDGIWTARLARASTSMPAARKGRGAVVNPPVRYERLAAEPFDDGWATLEQAFAAPLPVATEVTAERSRSAMAWNDSPDIGFDRSLNPYRGCEHGCVYCYARPSHAQVGLSPGLDFETRLIFKPDLPALLEKELRRPGYEARPVALGANTDPYQPIERTLRLTRAVLEVLERFRHPVTVVTKSAGVLRDLDILSRMAERNLVQVCISVTTLDAALARVMEPRAASPARRLQALGELARAGIPAGVLTAPIIPGLNDAEMERLLGAAAAQGATRAGYVLLRLPLEIAAMFEAWIRRHFPDRAPRVLALIRETRAGALSSARFGERMRGQGPYADLLANRFRLAARKLGLDKTTGSACRLDCSAFAVPDDGRPKQLALL
jgi:DNA repair photolyase